MMTVMKSNRPILVLPVFLSTVAMLLNMLQPGIVQAAENGSPKSLLSVQFLKQQPSLLDKDDTAKTAATQTVVSTSDEGAKLPMVQSPAYASNGLTRMTAGDTPRRINDSSNVVRMQRIPESSNVSDNQKIDLSVQSQAAERSSKADRTTYDTFNINMPPTEADGSVVGVSGLIPFDTDAESDSRLQPLQRLSGDISKNDLPSFSAIDRGERKVEQNVDRNVEKDAITHPAMESSDRPDTYSLASAVQDRSSKTASRAASPTPDSRSTDSHLHQLDVSEMKSAMFNGIQPGVTTKNEVLENMGQPNQTTPVDAATEILVYSLDELGTIEATIQRNIVFSLVWVLPVPYPSEQIRREGLEAELRGIRSIHVPDADGYILGQMFPEKGVIFSFVRSNTPGEASLMVNQIAIEPITSWPFELRGERFLTISNAKAKWDLTIAVQLDPNSHRARWLLAQAYLADDQLAEAQRECNFAIKLRADQPQYNVTLAEIIGKAGYTAEARQYLEYLLPHCENMPQLKGKAQCLLGDFYRDDFDLESAKKYHLAAIETVTPHLNSTNSTTRQQCELVRMNTFLSMALDISLSDWQDKEKNLPQWLDGAEKLALDLVIKEKMSQECLLDVALTAIEAHVNFPELGELEDWLDKLESTSDEIIMNDDDPATVRKIELQLAAALYDIEQVCEYLGDFKAAALYGQKAVEYFERHLSDSDDVINLYRLANLYYQLGRLEVTGRSSVQADKKSHVRAVGWFAKSIPLFQLIEASLDENETPVLGEMYVSIGASYWMIGEKNYAVQITEYGIGKLEEAVDDELVAERVLAIPYENLSSMYKSMGRLEEAENYYILSRQAGQNIASGSAKPVK